MFSFGWKLLVASLIDTLFNNLYGLIMGKIYNEELLGAYNRGDQFPKLIVNNLGGAIQSVLLPAFSARQGSVHDVRHMVRRAIRLSSFLVLPMLFGLMAVADTLVLALLGEQWLICVPYLRIMCVAYSFWPIHITNLQAINAVGRSDVFLKLEVIKKGMGLTGLIIGAQFGPLVMISIKAVLDFFSTFVNAWPNKKLLGYSIFSQWMDIMPSLILSLVMSAVVYGLQFVLPGGPMVKLLLQIMAGMVVYGGSYTPGQELPDYLEVKKQADLIQGIVSDFNAAKRTTSDSAPQKTFKEMYEEFYSWKFERRPFQDIFCQHYQLHGSRIQAPFCFT